MGDLFTESRGGGEVGVNADYQRFLETKIELAPARVQHEFSLATEHLKPLGSHLSLDDPQLMQGLETLSDAIETHFERFRLQMVTNRKGVR